MKEWFFNGPKVLDPFWENMLSAYLSVFKIYLSKTKALIKMHSISSVLSNLLLSVALVVSVLVVVRKVEGGVP